MTSTAAVALALSLFINEVSFLYNWTGLKEEHFSSKLVFLVAVGLLVKEISLFPSFVRTKFTSICFILEIPFSMLLLECSLAYVWQLIQDYVLLHIDEILVLLFAEESLEWLVCHLCCGKRDCSEVSARLVLKLITGVDFAGPFLIRDRLGRGSKLIKSYLCLFVCFTTRALHLELASDLSSDVFILCLRRFISRRGRPSEVHCDNGRNFVGANNELTNFLKSCNESISSFAADEGITFKFSPAYSPHFGGLWEAGIKSAKYHIHRMLGDTHLTYEELSTLLAQIEAILNSRPLTPLSSDPCDLFPLTPGHFLIGKPLTSMPSPHLLDMKTSRLPRYEQIEQMRQHFWERWRNEFLCELQQRGKWRISNGKLLQGDMVILKEPNLPPLKWRMGRIKELYPGSDGVARVADVTTARGVVRRAVHNLCPLPMVNQDEDSSRNPTAFEGGEYVRAYEASTAAPPNGVREPGEGRDDI